MTSDRCPISVNEQGAGSDEPAVQGGALFAEASTEFRLVALCCSPAFEGRAERIAALAAGASWDEVLHLAKRHRVGGLVHAALVSQDIPGTVRASLQRMASAIALANLRSLSVLASIKSALNGSAIPFAVMKGLPLGQLAYGSPGVRHSKDVDLLIAPELLESAHEVLASRGFARESSGKTLSTHQRKLWRRFRKHDVYRDGRTGVCVEVHWRAADNVQLRSPQREPIRFVEVVGQTLPVAATHDLLVDLCLHGAGHAWFRLKWIADVAALAAQEDPAALAELLKSARRNDVDRPMEQALLLCAALFPESFRGLLASPSRTGLWLAYIASRALLEESTRPPSAEADFVARGLKRSRLLLRRSWRYRLEEARVQAASPADWQTLAMPARWQFLYPLLRVPLWMKRRWLPRSRFAR